MARGGFLFVYGYTLTEKHGVFLCVFVCFCVSFVVDSHPCQPHVSLRDVRQQGCSAGEECYARKTCVEKDHAKRVICCRASPRARPTAGV